MTCVIVKKKGKEKMPICIISGIRSSMYHGEGEENHSHLYPLADKRVILQLSFEKPRNYVKSHSQTLVVLLIQCGNTLLNQDKVP